MGKGHKSTKVPGVKLRPAPKPKRQTSDPSSSAHPQSLSDTEGPNPDAEVSHTHDLFTEKPFLGVVLALSGFIDKSENYKMAESMGASRSNHLTEKTTHLAINMERGIGSQKYKVALERGMPILREEWIAECHKRWLAGDRVVLADTITEFRVTIFANLHVSLTGLDDAEEREAVQENVEKEGGTYYKAIPKVKRTNSNPGNPFGNSALGGSTSYIGSSFALNSSSSGGSSSAPNPSSRLTHLICGGESGHWEGEESDKLKYAKRYNAEVARGGGGYGGIGGEEEMIKVVWIEWYLDSLEFGGRMDEEAYLISKPRPEPRRRMPAPGSTRLNQRNSSLPHIIDLTAPLANPDLMTVSSSKMQRVGSKRVLEGLLKGRVDFKIEGGSVVGPPGGSQSQSQAKVIDISDSEEEAAQGEGEASGSSDDDDEEQGPFKDAKPTTSKAKGKAKAAPALPSLAPGKGKAGFGRTKSTIHILTDRSSAFDPADSERTKGGRTRLEEVVVKSMTVPGAAAPVVSEMIVESPLEDREDGPPQGEEVEGEDKERFFEGKRFLLIADMNAPNVAMQIKKCGGRISTTIDPEDADYILVRVASCGSMYSTASPSAQVKFRTECWLEWCFFEKRIVDEREHPLFIPIAIECPLPGERAKALRISFSGLGGDDALWAGRACHALGLQTIVFGRRTTQLICPDRSGAKYDRAIEWGIEVVDLDWLWDLTKNGVEQLGGEQEEQRDERALKPLIPGGKIPPTKISNSKGAARAGKAPLPPAPVLVRSMGQQSEVPAKERKETVPQALLRRSSIITDITNGLESQSQSGSSRSSGSASSYEQSSRNGTGSRKRSLDSIAEDESRPYPPETSSNMMDTDALSAGDELDFGQSAIFGPDDSIGPPAAHSTFNFRAKRQKVEAEEEVVESSTQGSVEGLAKRHSFTLLSESGRAKDKGLLANVRQEANPFMVPSSASPSPTTTNQHAQPYRFQPTPSSDSKAAVRKERIKKVESTPPTALGKTLTDLLVPGTQATAGSILFASYSESAASAGSGSSKQLERTDSLVSAGGTRRVRPGRTTSSNSLFSTPLSESNSMAPIPPREVASKAVSKDRQRKLEKPSKSPSVVGPDGEDEDSETIMWADANARFAQRKLSRLLGEEAQAQADAKEVQTSLSTSSKIKTKTKTKTKNADQASSVVVTSKARNRISRIAQSGA